jgi:hypothetical protein
MELFKIYTIGTSTRKYFVLNNKRAIELGWKFAIEVQISDSTHNLVVKNRYFCNSELAVSDGVNYWSKYVSLQK